MLRHLLRFAFLLAVLAAASLAGAALLERNEPVLIEWDGWILETRLWVVIAAVAAAVISGWLAIAVILAVVRAPRSIRQAVYDRRRERGMLALGQAFSAFAAEDGKTALTNARRAERLLADARITRPLVAKSLELSGLSREAKEYFIALAANRDTAESGARGLLAAAKREGDAESALEQARRVVELHPSDPLGHRELFSLLVRRANWSEAREALSSAVRHRAISRQDAQRLEAVAHGGEAVDAYESGNLERAMKSAQRASETDPGLSAPACLAAELLARSGQRDKAERLLLAAWRKEPVQEIAAAWSALEMHSGNPELARRHMLRLADANPSHPESRLVVAEAAVTAHDWPAAQAALGDLPSESPTARACAAMAAVEKAGNGNTALAQIWLARALDAPRGSYWTCGGCGCFVGGWAATCPECENVGTIASRKAVPAGGPAVISAIAPLIEEQRDPETLSHPPTTPPTTDGEVVEISAKGGLGEPFARPDA